MLVRTGGSWPTIVSHCTCPKVSLIRRLWLAPQPANLAVEIIPPAPKGYPEEGPTVWRLP